MALIPFGMKDGRLVDITGVERGLKCGCVCPSCQQRLVARFGEQTIPHFAHDKNADQQGVQREPCALSFYVALRLMIKQVANDNGSLVLQIPGMTISRHSCDNNDAPVTQSMQVAHEMELELTNISHQTVVDDTVLDLVGYFGSARFGVHFVYPGRQRCIGDFHSRIGVIEIDLTQLEWIYENYDFVQDKPFDQRVIEYLRGSIHAKQWYFHPSYMQAKSLLEKQVQQEVIERNIENDEARRKKERERHQILRRASQQEDIRRSKLTQLRAQGDWHCVRCNVAWDSDSKGTSCPNCFMPGAIIMIK
ncbi:competence protein CoiA family protein [Vibrio sp. Makdt]|uniref:competence protein CoiA family protein n=1 Tax=Vibrio sp. Makdt TaxID=2998828 RepID=UPI0022CDB54B|nr:competence protein CoiA family protein [Vibrio sp. Makdt]MDA0152317.1 competence protein CoiA family protein [Vibrio sp. Makdt]